jgi:hypothetical protein
MNRTVFTTLYLVLAFVSMTLWKQTGDLYWTLAASAFALASIRETLLLIKEIKRQ